MRRHLLSPALESFQVAGTELSLEEEQIVLGEAAQDQAQINADLNEAERVIEVSDALEDLAVIADGIEEATPAEAALIETAGDMAVAGTDVQAEEVVPAMESYIGRRIATEGLRETARQIWNNILGFLKQIWEKIEKFFYKIFGTIPSLRKRIEALEKRVDDASGKTMEEKKFKIGSGVAAFCQDYKPVKTEAELAKALKEMSETADYVYGSNTDDMAKCAEGLADIIGDFEPSKAEEQAKKAVEKVASYSKGGKKIPGSSAAPSIPGFKVEAGAQLLGNVRLIDKIFTDSTEKGVLGALDMARRSGCEIGKAREKEGTVPSDFEFATLSLSGASAILKDATKLLDTLEEFKRGKGWREVNKAKDKLKSASDKAAKAFEKLKDSEEKDEKAALPYFKGLLNFNQAFTRWVQSPAVPLLSHGLSAVRASMVAVEKSLACYK